MNKMTKLTAIVVAVLMLAGVYFKTMHWPGANVIMISGTFISALLFISLIVRIPSVFETVIEKVSFVIGSSTLFLAFLAFLFKMVHWPGAAKLIWLADLGILLTTIIFLVDAFLERKPEKWSLKILVAFFALFMLLMILIMG